MIQKRLACDIDIWNICTILTFISFMSVLLFQYSMLIYLTFEGFTWIVLLNTYLHLFDNIAPNKYFNSVKLCVFLHSLTSHSLRHQVVRLLPSNTTFNQLTPVAVLLGSDGCKFYKFLIFSLYQFGICIFKLEVHLTLYIQQTFLSTPKKYIHVMFIITFKVFLFCFWGLTGQTLR